MVSPVLGYHAGAQAETPLILGVQISRASSLQKWKIPTRFGPVLRSQVNSHTFKCWLDARLARVSGRSKLADVICYAIRHWDGLIRFLDDGRIEINSNTVERSIRPIALNRKMYSSPVTIAAAFTGHHRFAHRDV